MWSDASRNDLRQMYFICWEKHSQQVPLEPVEQQIIGVILDHPEYHDILAQPERYLDQDYIPETGVTNPFLHMAMHLVIRDQLHTNTPLGIRAVYDDYVHKLQDPHGVEHRFLDCLGEVMWQAEKNQQTLCNEDYLSLLKASLP